MDTHTPNTPVLGFGVFELDCASGELRRHGLKVRLPEQSFQVLRALLSSPGDVVTRDELHRVLWPSDTFVDFEVGLNSAVRKLREALDESAEHPRFIETLPRRGYRFHGSVTERSSKATRASATDADQAAVSVPVTADEQNPLPVSAPAPGTARQSRLTAWRTGGLLLIVLVAAAGLVYRAGWFRALGAGAGGERNLSAAVDGRAYDAYLKGLTASGLQRNEGFQTAVAYFEQAVAIQPDFGEAYAELALAQVQFLFGGPFTPRETIPKAEAAARKAIQLNETLPRAHWALGQLLSLYYWQWEEGHTALQRAAELQGGHNGISTALIESLIRHRRFTEAVAAAERGRDLDPLSVNAQIAVGTAYRAAGQHDRAIDELRRALEMMPRNTRVHFQLGATFVIMGRLDAAIPELELAARQGGHNSRVEAYLGYVYAALGRTHDAHAILQELESHRRDQHVSSFGIALIHDALGQKAPALVALQRARDERAVEFGQMAQYPPFKAIASEPAFRAVMRQVNLPR